jgi:hypothetical protein
MKMMGYGDLRRPSPGANKRDQMERERREREALEQSERRAQRAEVEDIGWGQRQVAAAKKKAPPLALLMEP